MNKWLQKIKIQMSGVTVRGVLIGVKTKNGSWNKKMTPSDRSVDGLWLSG